MPAGVARRTGPPLAHSVQLQPSIVFNEITDQKLLATPRSTRRATASSTRKAVRFCKAQWPQTAANMHRGVRRAVDPATLAKGVSRERSRLTSPKPPASPARSGGNMGSVCFFLKLLLAAPYETFERHPSLAVSWAPGSVTPLARRPSLLVAYIASTSRPGPARSSPQFASATTWHLRSVSVLALASDRRRGTRPKTSSSQAEHPRCTPESRSLCQPR